MGEEGKGTRQLEHHDARRVETEESRDQNARPALAVRMVGAHVCSEERQRQDPAEASTEEAHHDLRGSQAGVELRHQ